MSKIEYLADGTSNNRSAAETMTSTAAAERPLPVHLSQSSKSPKMSIYWSLKG
jgi:hypothetical protein